MTRIYTRRILDEELDEFQPHLAALEIYGAKGVGKTAMATQRTASVIRLDLARERERLQADPGLIADLPRPVLLDEWTRLPEVWDEVRRLVDDGIEPGSLLLTGSATVPRGINVHSGAGRIVGFRLRPLSLAERGLEQPTVSLRELLSGVVASVTGSTQLRLADYVREIVASGFPDIHNEPRRVRAARLDSYLRNLSQKEFPEQGYSVRRPAALQAWMTAYAAATASTASYNRIMEASTPGVSEKPGRAATASFREALESLWMLDKLEAWLPTRNLLQRLGEAPKHFLADPALSCRLLGLDEQTLLRGEEGLTRGQSALRDGTILGALFEHLAVLSVLTYAQVAEAEVRHLRTHGGEHEIDMIVRRPDDRVVAVEVKLAQSVTDADVKHMVWLRDQIGADFLDGMVLSTGEHAYRRKDGIAVVPLALLGP